MDQPPRTIDEAVERLREQLPADELAAFAALAEDDLASCHFGLGLRIRNDFGLWDKDSPLLHDCLVRHGRPGHFIHPDHASRMILYTIWARLRQ
jgi:hypothetical protein